jgi:hypothetical protein
MNADSTSPRSRNSPPSYNVPNHFSTNNSLDFKKTLAVRWTPSSLNEMLAESINFTNECYWSSMTHFVFQGLTFRYDGSVGIPETEKHTPDSEYPSMIPTTCIPLMDEIASNWKHISFVWSLPMLIDNMYVNTSIKNNPAILINSLTTLVAKYNIDILEMDIVLLKYIKDINLLKNIGCKFWFTYVPSSNQIPNLNLIYDSLQELLHADLLDAAVVKSYGNVRVCRTPTSHGTYQSMFVYPESSLTDFKIIFNWLRIALPANKIIMDLDTCGVEYVVSKIKPGFVDRFRIIPNKSIRHRKLFGNSNFQDRYDVENGCSIVEFPDDNVVISYDNQQVQKQKTHFVLENDLRGVIVGELSHDLHPLHPESLLSKTRNNFINYATPGQ